MSRYWSPIVHRLRPYVPGEQPPSKSFVKLNTNESPYGPSPLALAAIREATDDDLRLYPEPTAAKLRQAIGLTYELRPEEVFVGNGSDEVLAHAFQALLDHEAPTLFPDVTYAFYSSYCRLFGIRFEQVATDDDFRVRVESYRRPCGAIILPNPNAPTGISLPLREVRRLLDDHVGQVVVIDEAYVDFGSDSAASLVRHHPNLVVVQTFSKSRGLAGLRVGFALAQRPLIEALERVKDSFNSYPLDRLALAGALASWDDRGWFDARRRQVVASREWLVPRLVELGFDVLPSTANFVMARHRMTPGPLLASELRRRSILVRNFAVPRIQDFLRITVGTDQQCERLVETLAEILP